MEKKKPTKEEIQKLIDEHLIGWWTNETPAFKGHYKIIPENLIEFIIKYII